MRARVAVLLALVACVLASTAAAASPRVDGGLTLTRPDGTRLASGEQFRVRCGPWKRDVPVRAIHVIAGSRRSASFWFLSAVLADVTRPTTVKLPNSFVFSEPKGALLFTSPSGDGKPPTSRP